MEKKSIPSAFEKEKLIFSAPVQQRPDPHDRPGLHRAPRAPPDLGQGTNPVQEKVLGQRTREGTADAGDGDQVELFLVLLFVVVVVHLEESVLEEAAAGGHGLGDVLTSERELLKLNLNNVYYVMTS